MEQEIVRLLADTQSSQQTPRKNAELQLRQLYPNHAFPLSLVTIGASDHYSIDIRQSALLYLKTFVQSAWSTQFEEFKGEVLVNEEDRRRLRQLILELATSNIQERKIKGAASIVVSKIASADFPDDWPDLLPSLLHVINTGAPGQLHGALKVLKDLIEDCFNAEQFFPVAKDIVSSAYAVAADGSRTPILRALAVSVFRSCFDILEMVLEDHKAAVKGFAEEALQAWFSFFASVLNERLPQAPSEDSEDADTGDPERYRGLVALKIQAVKVLSRVRSLFPSTLAPQAPLFFSTTWEELGRLQPDYQHLYLEEDRQGRLEDADGLEYTLDFLVLEELDFMQACIRAPTVRKQLEQRLQAETSPNTWVTEVMKLTVAYAHITTEEEGLWDIDVNVFLSEESSITANYTPRTACADVATKLGEWQRSATLQGLLYYTQSLHVDNANSKTKEAALYILHKVMVDFYHSDREIGLDIANGYVEFVNYALQQDDAFLRARGHLVAGCLSKIAGEPFVPISVSFMENTLYAVSHDPSDVVRVSCIRALQDYLIAIPPATTLPMQQTIVSSLQEYLSQQDLNDMTESEDIMITIVETLRDIIMKDPSICVTGSGIDVLFTIASHGASNFQLAMLVTDAFKDIAEALSETGPELYTELCRKVLPSLSGAFDLGSMSEENALTTLAAEMLSILAEHGLTPLPNGFIATTMPKLNRLLLDSSDDELLKSATSAVRYMLQHDPDQMFSWHNEVDGKGGLEVILIIVDRLLNPDVDDNAAAEVGGLAAELVERAGSERLGPYLPQLLNAVAVRLSTAQQAHFIQSLILVFARLSLISAPEVVDFLSQLRIGQESGLKVVITKWLENSVNFAGYDEIRQNITALTKLYDLHDERLSQIQVKGDLIVSQSTRIMTRSRARQNPDQYTMIPATLKIVKVLVEEVSQGPDDAAVEAAAAAKLDEEGSDEEEEWEDEPNGILDLGSGMTKEQLMAYAENDAPSRGKDDETQAMLFDWFRTQAGVPGFANIFNSLTSDEQQKLRSMR